MGVANPHDIYNIMQQEAKLKNLDKVLFETAGEIGRLNFAKTHLEKEVEERMETMNHRDSILVETDP